VLFLAEYERSILYSVNHIGELSNDFCKDADCRDDIKNSGTKLLTVKSEYPLFSYSGYVAKQWW